MAKQTRPEPITIIAKVLDVTNVFNKQGECNEGEVKITIDKELTKINPNDGEITKSNNFVKKLKELQNQLSPLVPAIRRVARLGMGKRINPVLCSIALCDAEIEIVGEYHFKNEQRTFEGATANDIYTSDCWVYRITKVTKEWSPEDIEDFEAVRTSEPYIVTKTAATTSTLPSWYK